MQLTVLVAVALLLVPAAGLLAQVIPTNEFTNFFDSASTFEGNLLPVGSVIDAYDPDSVHCGQFVVHTEGMYGFMPVYGDDNTTPSVDEGADAGDTIRFKINGRDADVVLGDPTWTDQENKQVRLSVPAAVFALTIVDPAADQFIAPGRTARFQAGVRNDGDGLDFYSVAVNVDQAGWTPVIPDSLFYNDVGETTYVYWDVQVPVFPGVDTVGVVEYTVYSKVDTTVRATDTAMLVVSITDVDDGDNSILPNQFTLNQNYPNPFNPTTIVPFALPAASAVRFEVYDVLGRRVENRDLGTLSAGEHELEFDGASLASGVYLYRIVTESASDSRKMILLK